MQDVVSLAAPLRSVGGSAPVHRSDDLCVRALYVRAVRSEVREADFVCSTDAIDAHGSRVEQVWDLNRYLANPVVLFGHQSCELPIGQAKNVGVVDGELRATIAFGSAESNPMAEQVWRCVQEKTLRAVSVGFLPHSVRFERENGVEIEVLSDNELYELSVVPIPSNEECLARIRARALALKPTPSPPEPGTEIPMNETEKKALEDKLSQREADIRVAEKALTDSRAALETAKAEKAAIESQNTHLVTERDALKARAEKAEGEIVAKDVDALVGVKIAPVEKELFVELAKSNRPLFEKMVAQRSDMKLLGSPVIPTEAAPLNTDSTPGDLGTEIQKALEQA